ncbi:MAG: type IV pilin protein [Elusimicrobiales bacterium]
MKKRKNFTLIELLVVVIIISTLVSIATPTYFRVVERFRVVEATTVINDIRKAEEEILIRKGRYSDDFSELYIEIYDKNNQLCSGKTCELKYFIIQIRLITPTSYQILAQRKSDVTPPPQRYSPNYIYFYDSKTRSYLCNDANCAKDFLI